MNSGLAGSSQGHQATGVLKGNSEADFGTSPKLGHEANFKRQPHYEINPTLQPRSAATAEILPDADTCTGAAVEQSPNADAVLQHATLPDDVQNSFVTGDAAEAQGSSEACSEPSNSRATAGEEDRLKRLDMLYAQQVQRIKAAAVELPEEAEVLVTDLIDHRQAAALFPDTRLYTGKAEPCRPTCSSMRSHIMMQFVL